MMWYAKILMILASNMHQTISNNIKQHKTTWNNIVTLVPWGPVWSICRCGFHQGGVWSICLHEKNTRFVSKWLNDKQWKHKTVQDVSRCFKMVGDVFWQLSMTLSWARCDFSSPVEPCERCRMPHGAIMGYPRAPHVHQMVSTCFKDIMSYQIIS